MKPLRVLCLLGMLAGCHREPRTNDWQRTWEDAGLDADFGPPPPTPTPRRGMAWVAPGALVAGTPVSERPRIADREMPGEQVILKGFYIDQYPYPNEEGAIPLTNVDQAEAERLCAEQGKRLCTELEWERACKGPNNLTYEYGRRYQAGRCATGQGAHLVPNGLNAGCVSEFEVHDLHGGAWEWTISRWGRGDTTGRITVRGGNGVAGEVVGRCAYGESREPTYHDQTLGFRCCAGPRNLAEVTLRVVRGPKLERRDRVDKKLGSELIAALPAAAREELGYREGFHFDHLWIWWPIGNDELWVAGGCVGLGKQPACGVFITRRVLDEIVPVTSASSGYWVPQVHADLDARYLWLFGADDLGQYRSLLTYQSGDVQVGPRERRMPKPRKRRTGGR